MRAAVFLDRDGTLIEECGFLDALERMRLFPWSGEALRVLQRAGLALVLVTNQSGVARGFFDEAFVRASHEHLAGLLEPHGVRLDGYYYCPHHPEGTVPRYRRACACRKPAPGLVHTAARDLGLDVSRSYVVGDKWSDVGLARSAGAAGVLVRSGYGARTEAAARDDVRPAAVLDTLLDAARWIAGRSGQTDRRAP